MVIKEVDNKIPDFSGLIKKTNYDSEILEMEGKYFWYNKFTSETLDAKIKKKKIELVNQSDIYNLIKRCDVNRKHATLTTKAVWKAEQDKIAILKTFVLSYFLVKICFAVMVFKICLFINQHLIR